MSECFCHTHSLFVARPLSPTSVSDRPRLSQHNFTSVIHFLPARGYTNVNTSSLKMSKGLSAAPKPSANEVNPDRRDSFRMKKRRLASLRSVFVRQIVVNESSADVLYE